MNPSKVIRQDIGRLHLSLRETPVQANRVLAMISALYGFAARAGYVPEGYNPARGIEKFPERSRERFLTNDELARLGETLRLAEITGLPWRIRFAVCVCFGGAALSASRIASMTGTRGPSIGRSDLARAVAGRRHSRTVGNFVCGAGLTITR
jgi:hypothetical protein